MGLLLNKILRCQSLIKAICFRIPFMHPDILNNKLLANLWINMKRLQAFCICLKYDKTERQHQIIGFQCVTMIHTHTVHTPWVNPSIRFLILPSSTLSLFALATILPSVLLFSSFFDPRLPQSNLLIFPLLPVWTNSLLFTDQFLALSSLYPLPFLLFKSPILSLLLYLKSAAVYFIQALFLYF